MKIPNQILKEEARRLLDYRDGMLYWQHSASGQRNGGRAITWRKSQEGRKKPFVRLGGSFFSAHYLVWNWHHGITRNMIRFADGNSDNFRIENLVEARAEILATLLRPVKHSCPCCEQSVPQPTVDIIAHAAGLSPLQESILRAVWSGKGRAVQPETIFNEMYADDPDGGPSASKMYAAFKVALCHLREKLVGTGVSIENVGYRQGYRLVMNETGGLNGGLSQQGADHRERGARP
ncbi:HNH endonuclease [Hyphomicrobium sp. 99]|uniref:HNH endonuclease n=1 Tax=Hyphomicrobium sp. 99 TaxID=1163419 RepID=UPI0018CD942A|nr:HNH endonuclease [Hyphomicrobium sp. 99]